MVGCSDQLLDLLGQVLEGALVFAAGLADAVAEVVRGFGFRLGDGGRLGECGGDGFGGAFGFGAGLAGGVAGALDELWGKVSHLVFGEGEPWWG